MSSEQQQSVDSLTENAEDLQNFEKVDSFDDMGLREEVLRGISA